MSSALPENLPSRSRAVVWILVSSALLGLLSAGLRPAGCLWTVDAGNKLLLTRSILSGSVLDPELPYPGRTIDPELRWAPIAPPFGVVDQDRLLSQYPPAFALLCAPLLRVFGERGLFVLPLLGGLLTILGAAWVARRVGGSPSWAALLAGPCSVLQIYSVSFWEHTLAAAALVWSYGWIAGPARGRRATLAGVLLGLSIWMREELLLLLPVFVVFIVLEQRRALLRFLTGFAMTWVPFASWMLATTGSPFGRHLLANVRLRTGLPGAPSTPVPDGLVEWLGGRLAVAETLWMAVPESPDRVLALLGALFSVLLIVAIRTRVKVSGPLLLVAALGLSAVTFGLARTLLDPEVSAQRLVVTSGLVLFVPWLGLAAGPASSSSMRRLGWFLVLALAGFTLATPTVTATGVHWGPRILVSLLPLLAVRAAWPIPPARWSRLALVFLAVASVGLQICGLVVHRRELARIDRLQTQVELTDGPIVTPIWWYAQMMPRVYPRRTMFLVQSRAEIEDWLLAFTSAGGDRFVWAAPGADDLWTGLPVRVARPLRVDVPGYAHLLRPVIVLGPGAHGLGVDRAWDQLRRAVSDRRMARVRHPAKPDSTISSGG